MFAMQGPHQVAQNSTTYTLPLSNFSTLSPLTQTSTARAGALSPTFRYDAGCCALGCFLSGFLASCPTAPAAAMSIAAVTAVNRFNMWASPGIRALYRLTMVRRHVAFGVAV